MMRTNSWRRERCVKNKTIRTSVFTCRPNCKVEGLGRRKSEGLSPREFRGLPSHKTEPGGASKYLSHKLVELAEFAMLKSRETSVFFVGDCVTTMQGEAGRRIGLGCHLSTKLPLGGQKGLSIAAILLESITTIPRYSLCLLQFYP
jgi:hypothetical protein